MKTFKDLKREKKEAEQKIRDILTDFCSKNECEVGDIEVQSITFQEINKSQETYIIDNVEINVKV